MRRIASTLFAATLSLALVACGGGGSGQEQSGDSDSTEKTEVVEEKKEEAKPEEKFIGEWKVAGAKMESVVVVGDLSAMGNSMNMSINEDGTVLVSMGDSENTRDDLTWKLSDDDHIVIDGKGDGEDFDPVTIDVFYVDDHLEMVAPGEDSDQTYYLSKDGTIPEYAVIDTSNATPVTDETDLVGTWKMAGMSYQSMTMYGDSEALATMTGQDELSVDLTLNADGTAKMGDETATWTKTDSGITFAGDKKTETTIVLTADVLKLDKDTIVLKLNGDWASMDMSIIYKRS